MELNPTTLEMSYDDDNVLNTNNELQFKSDSYIISPNDSCSIPDIHALVFFCIQVYELFGASNTKVIKLVAVGRRRRRRRTCRIYVVRLKPTSTGGNVFSFLDADNSGTSLGLHADLSGG